MKQNTDIEHFRNKGPFRVPENYFPKLKKDIQFKTENIGSVLEFKFKNYFNLQNLTSGLVSVCVILIIYNYINSSVSKFDNLNLEVYAQFIEFEIENIDEEYFLELLPQEEYAFSDEIEYLLENDIYFNQIID